MSPHADSRPSAAARVVVVLMGLPGAGKSTIARRLLAELPLHAVDRDAIRAALFPDCEFTRAEKDAANAAVLAAVAANCRLGRATLVDGMTFARAADLEAVRTCARSAGYALVPLYVDCPVAVAQARVDARGAKPHVARDRTAALVAEVAARFDPLPGDACRVEGDQEEAAMCAAALAVVRVALGSGSERGQSLL